MATADTENRKVKHRTELQALIRKQDEEDAAKFFAFRNCPSKTRQDYLDQLAIRNANYTTPPRDLGPDATPDEIAAERERRLTAPTTRHRGVWLNWPRDPSGDAIATTIGKMLPNGLEIWAASMLDFYSINRVPSATAVDTYTSSSKIYRWMKEHGEEHAADHIAAAEREAMPREIHPYPIGALLQEYDNLKKTFQGTRRIKPKQPNAPRKPVFGRDKPFNKLLPVPILQKRIPYRLLPKTLIVHDPTLTLCASPPDSPPPKSWDSCRDVISTYHLHLSPDGVRSLAKEKAALAQEAESAAAHLAAFLANPTADNRPKERGILVVPAGSKPGPSVPAVFFMHAARPVVEFDKKDAVAHLYMSANDLVGQGHHSFAYDVEWEVPRAMLVEEEELGAGGDEVLCKKCVLDKGLALLAEEDGPTGKRKAEEWKKKTGRVVETLVELPGLLAESEDEEDNVLYELMEAKREVSKKYHGPVRVVETGVEFQNSRRAPLCEHLSKKGKKVASTTSSWADAIRQARYDMDDKKRKQKGKIEEEEKEESLTARVRVVAKLGIQYDGHLPREARNYQAFPTHFFQHWSGMNLLRPIHEPWPVGALVPQFYGYYLPDTKVPLRYFDRFADGGKEESEQANDGKMEGIRDGDKKNVESTDDTMGGVPSVPDKEVEGAGDVHIDTPNIPKGEDSTNGKTTQKGKDIPEVSYTYRSPILLMENCGHSVCSIVDEMNIDDRKECASLVLRMHHEGWGHNSMYTRNILHQPGPINESPFTRSRNATGRNDLRQTSFRLIDFGRTMRLDDPELREGRRREEQDEVLKTFNIPLY